MKFRLELHSGAMTLTSAVSGGDELRGVDAGATLITGGLVALGFGAIVHGFSLALRQGPLDGWGPFGFGEAVGGAAALARALEEWSHWRAVMGLWRDMVEEARDERERDDRPKIRVVPVYRAGARGRSVLEGEGVDPGDLRFFVEQLPVRGHRERDWLGAALPSGARITSWRDWDRFISLLEQAGLYTGRSPRVSGRLATSDVGKMLAVLGLSSG